MAIGKVSATEKTPTSNDTFLFWLDGNVEVKPFDIIKAENNIGNKKSVTYAIVQDIYHITDSVSHLANFISSDFGDINHTPYSTRIGVTYAVAEVINNTDEVYMPLLDGTIVDFADEKEIKEALGLNDIENPIPAGFMQGTNQVSVPIHLNKDFLIGPEGAHVNISGISGLATKTSYAMFLLQSIQQTTRNTAVIILNVKGNDLLRIDELNPLLGEKHKHDWDKVGLKSIPFQNVKYYYPYKNDEDHCYANTSCELEALQRQFDISVAKNYIYTYNENKANLELLFSNIDDPNFTMESILNYIVENRDFQDLNWEEFKQKLAEYTQSGNNKSNRDITVQSWRKFKRLITKSINNPIFQYSASSDVRKRHCTLSEEIKKIKGNEVYVVDIAKLDENLQYFVFGDVLKAINELKFGETARHEEDIPGKVIIFVDELNKYAGSNTPKNSPILTYLLDVTERGRSEGIILFSAEQFKSSTHDRIKGNCSTHIYGRTNAIEISKPDYRYIPKVFTNMMTRLRKGELIIQHAIFGTPLKITFPFPSYYQRGEKDE